MTTPSIADVKAAAEVVADATAWKIVDDRKLEVATHEWEAAKILADFALSILNAPGLSAERLDEIQREIEGVSIQSYGDEPDSWMVAKFGDDTFSTDDDPISAAAAWAIESLNITNKTLLAEVLRLRAGVTLPDGAESNHSPIDPNWRSFCKSFDEALARLTKRPDGAEVE